jgi:4-hydroxy-tetrahydrodipicolinate synthase
MDPTGTQTGNALTRRGTNPFSGAHTALVTPFRNGKVSWEDLSRLIEHQVAGGIHGLVAVGTTGESPTLDYDEHIEVIQRTVEFSRGRLPVMAGTGSNATAEAVDLVQRADAVGVSSHLQVAPYYNKPSQEGLFRHFSAIAEATERPIILYSIPSRCGIEIAVETVVRLRKAYRNIVGIKEAGGSVEKAGRLVRELDPEFTVLSGDDALTVAFAEFGAQGIISVASNLIPAEVSKLARLCGEGNLPEARDLHIRLSELFRTLFVEPNPVPVKHLLARAGIISSAEVRLPLCEMSAANRAAVEAVADAFQSTQR